MVHDKFDLVFPEMQVVDAAEYQAFQADSVPSGRGRGRGARGARGGAGRGRGTKKVNPEMWWLDKKKKKQEPKYVIMCFKYRQTCV